MSSTTSLSAASTTLAGRVPPHGYFLVSAVFHYLGPSFAVLLFQALAPAGVAWLRIAGAGLVFALWRRPFNVFRTLPRAGTAASSSPSASPSPP